MGLQSINTKQFLALLSAALSLTLLSSGLVTWVAANWQHIAPQHKILLVQGVLLVIGIALAAIRLRSTQGNGTDKPSTQWWYQGLAFLGAVVSGALIALVGQIYQSGADSWQLFAFWSVLILPWLFFFPNVFITTLFVVVANTAAVLFLKSDSLAISEFTATYILAALNFLLFLLIEHKKARYEPLWAVLSTTLLICTIIVFVSAGWDRERGAIALHLLFAAVVLMFLSYSRFAAGLIRIKVLNVAVIAAALSSFILEKMSSLYWYGDSFGSIFMMMGLIWTVAAFVIIFLLRSHNKKSDDDTDSTARHDADAPPASISVFLSLSSILVAGFFFLAFYITIYVVFDDDALFLNNGLALFLFAFATVGFYFSRAKTASYALLVLYEIAVFMRIENYFSNEYIGSYSEHLKIIVWGSYGVVFLALVMSALIYRRRTEPWIRFVVSLSFFILLSILSSLHYFVLWFGEYILMLLSFMALMWWFFKRAKTIQLPLFLAFILWALLITTKNLAIQYNSMHFDVDRVVGFKGVLLSFYWSFKLLLDKLDMPFLMSLNSFVHWFLTLIVSLMPLWSLGQLTKNKNATTKIVAWALGFLVAWLWYGRIEIIMTFSFLVLAYHHKSRVLFYSAVVLGLISLCFFYFSLFVPLEEKAYLLLFTGTLFLLLYVIFAKKLLNDNNEESVAIKSSDNAAPVSDNGLKDGLTPIGKPRFYGLLTLALLLSLGSSQWQVAAYERILTKGQFVLLRLQPVDPRSLIQGDYMSINYELSSRVNRDLQSALDDKTTTITMSEQLREKLSTRDRMKVMAAFRVIDGVAEQTMAFYEASEITAFDADEDIVYLPFIVNVESFGYRINPNFSTEFFFNEKEAVAFEEAKFAEVAVSEKGVLLKALRDIDRNKIGTATFDK